MMSATAGDCVALASRFAAEAIRQRLDPLDAIFDRIAVAFDFLDPELMTMTVDAVTLAGAKIRGTTNVRPPAMHRSPDEIRHACDYLAHMIATTLHREPGPPYPLPASLRG